MIPPLHISRFVTGFRGTASFFEPLPKAPKVIDFPGQRPSRCDGVSGERITWCVFFSRPIQIGNQSRFFVVGQPIFPAICMYQPKSYIFPPKKLNWSANPASYTFVQIIYPISMHMILISRGSHCQTESGVGPTPHPEMIPPSSASSRATGKSYHVGGFGPLPLAALLSAGWERTQKYKSMEVWIIRCGEI